MKHLKSGDDAPLINSSGYTLFSNRFCPYCDRVRLALGYHKIEYDLIQIAYSDKPDWYVQMSSSGKVPMLLDHGTKRMESDMIMRFVDELRGPNNSLMPMCGMDKFTEAVALGNRLSGLAYALLYKPSIEDQTVTSFRTVCDEINKAIKGEYFAGKELSLADLAIFPMADRVDAIVAQLKGTDPNQVKECSQAEADASEWPRLANYVLRMRRLPVVASVRQPTRILALYAQSFRQGKPDPDICQSNQSGIH